MSKKLLVLLMFGTIPLFANLFSDYRSFAQFMGYETEYETALKKARKSGKKLLVVYVKEGCPFCQKMEDELLTEQYVRRYIKKHFVPLILNRDLSKYIPKNLKAPFAPITYVIDPKTQKVEKRIMGYMESEQYLWQF